MKIKVSDATPPQINCLVAKCEGWTITTASDKQGKYLWLVMGDRNMGLKQYRPSTNWMQGGPIIEREGIAVWSPLDKADGAWIASYSFAQHEKFGPTPLIAAMRCFVASRLGDTIDIPEELT